MISILDHQPSPQSLGPTKLPLQAQPPVPPVLVQPPTTVYQAPRVEPGLPGLRLITKRPLVIHRFYSKKWLRMGEINDAWLVMANDGDLNHGPRLNPQRRSWETWNFQAFTRTDGLRAYLLVFLGRKYLCKINYIYRSLMYNIDNIHIVSYSLPSCFLT